MAKRRALRKSGPGPGDALPALRKRVAARERRQAALRKAEISRQDHEARYRALFEGSDQGICIHRDFTILFANPALTRMFGFASPTEVIGFDLRSALPAGERMRLEAYSRARLEGSGTALHHECEVSRRDGTRIRVRIMLCAVPWDGSPAVLATVTDVTAHKLAEDLAAGQVRLLEMIGDGRPLREILESLVLLIEAHGDGMLASVLLLDADGVHLRHGAAPSLPESYVRAIDGAAIGPNAGSCGTAAYLRQPTVASKIASDPLWVDYRDLALAHGLQACWSTPILSGPTRVLGTFALYYREPREPGLWELRLIETATRLARIAIEHCRTEEARARLADLVWESPDPLLWLDRGGALRALNPAAERMSGYPAAELVDRPLSTTRLLDAPSLDRTAECVRRLQAGEPARATELTILRKDGTRLTVDANWHATRDGREITGVVMALHDVTDRRRAEEALRASEERYRRLFERNMAGVFRSTLDGRMLECNPALADILGHPSPESVLAMNAKEFYLDPAGRERLLSRLGPGQTLANYETRWRRVDGSIIWVLLNVRRGEGEASQDLEGIVIDVSDRKRAEEAQSEAAALRSAAHLANGAAHEINNPLTVVVGRLDLLMSRLPVDSAEIVLAEKARAACNRIRDIVHGMYRITRVEYLQGLDQELPPILDIRKSSDD